MLCVVCFWASPRESHACGEIGGLLVFGKEGLTCFGEKLMPSAFDSWLVVVSICLSFSLSSLRCLGLPVPVGVNYMGNGGL